MTTKVFPDTDVDDANEQMEKMEEPATHVLADAWGEGYGAGWNDCLLDIQRRRSKPSHNPYV